MNEFEQFLIDHGIDDSEALQAVLASDDRSKDNRNELNRAAGKYTLEGDIRRDHPALRDTLPQLPPPEFVDWGNGKPTQPSAPAQIAGGLADTGMDMLRHPVATASMLTAFPLGLLPGVALETAGEVADTGYDQAYKLGQHLVQNPEDTGHMLKGLGMSIAELPSKAADMGTTLWQDLKDWGANQPKQNHNKMIHETFDPMRP